MSNEKEKKREYEKEKSVCLWCGKEIYIEKSGEEYQFCPDCLENLELVEDLMIRCNITDIAEAALKQ